MREENCRVVQGGAEPNRIHSGSCVLNGRIFVHACAHEQKKTH